MSTCLFHTLPFPPSPCTSPIYLSLSSLPFPQLPMSSLNSSSLLYPIQALYLFSSTLPSFPQPIPYTSLPLPSFTLSKPYTYLSSSSLLYPTQALSFSLFLYPPLPSTTHALPLSSSSLPTTTPALPSPPLPSGRPHALAPPSPCTGATL